MAKVERGVSALLESQEPTVLAAWLARLKDEGALHSGRMREGELVRSVPAPAAPGAGHRPR